jgi:uncharacterized spore protein YtfJ
LKEEDMSDNEFDSTLKAVSAKLIEVAKERGVLGEPLAVGNTAILPLCEIKLGFGGAGGQGQGEGEGDKAEQGKGAVVGGVGGGGVRVTPVALMVISGDEVSLESLEEGGA